MDTSEDGGLETAVPDLLDIPLDCLAVVGGTVLANAVREYRDRLAGGGTPPKAFNSSI